MNSRYLLVGLLLLAAACIGGAMFVEHDAHGDSMLEQQVSIVEKNLSRFDRQMKDLIEDEATWECLAQESFGCRQVNGLEQLPFSILLYQQDSLVYWNNNTALPPTSLLMDWEGVRTSKLKNGYYLIRSRLMEGDLHALVMLPIRYQFQISNGYLQTGYNRELWLKEGYLLLLSEREGAMPVVSEEDKTLFYLTKARSGDEHPLIPLTTILYILGFAAYLLLLYQLAKHLALMGHSLGGLAFLVLTLGSSRLLSIKLDIPHFIHELKLFGTHYYASSGIAASLGDLMVILLLAAIPAIYFFYYVDTSKWTYNHSWQKVLHGVVTTFVVFLMLRIAIDIFRSLVVDSSISFDVDNVFSLDYLSFAGLFCLTLILGVYFIVNRTLVRNWLDADDKGSTKFLALCVGTLIYLAYDLSIGLSSSIDRLLLLGLMFIGFCELIRRQKVVSFSIVHMLLWVAFFAFLSAGLLIRFNDIKTSERAKVYAQRISKEQDPQMEFLFADIKDGIATDNFVRAFLANPILNTKAQADSRLRLLYLANVDKRYEINTIYMNAAGKQVNTLAPDDIQPEDWEEIISVYGERTAVQDLYYVDRGGKDYFYLGLISLVEEDTGIAGTVLLQFKPRSRQSNSVYPELLAEAEDVFSDFDKLDYGIYLNSVLSDKSGDYSYPYYFPFETSDQEFELQRTEGYKHLLYAATPAKRVVVSDKEDHSLRPVSLFSYLFLFFLFITLLVGLLRVLIGIIVFRKPYWTIFANSLRSRIQALVIALILFSFLVIGIVTVVYFTNQYSSYHKSRLLRKTRTIQTDLLYRLNDAIDPAVTELLTLDRAFGDDSDLIEKLNLREVADIHSMDINIYDDHGRLLRSSEPNIFDKNLISRRINASAFRKIRWEGATQVVQNERIGNLRYLSAYLPVREETGEVIAFINLPYFAKQRNLRAEIASFMVTLINVYVFLLVGAGLIALFISNSITRSLAKISSQFTKVRLRGRNEPIAWRSQDEIGMLVSEYNKMLAELERSADLLALSERESAWRDMAKQVAHEIKNPLTPMRLSVQHLQRAQQDGRDNLDEMTRRVSKTLLEQIDNLTHIASEFSNFAKMPKSEAVKMDLTEVINSVVDLFRENEQVAIESNLPNEPIYILADKNQMIRVFNNLIKNAIQAIPEDKEGRVVVTMEATADKVRAVVGDNGVGIPEGQRARVFVPNFTTKSSGMGLGLSMCKNIVESFEGKIWFETEEGVGTDFCMEFPAIIEQPVEADV